MPDLPPAQPRRGSAAWLNAQYNNRGLVPQSPQILQRWQHQSALFRQQAQAEGRLVSAAYGPAPSEGVDIFLPPASRRDATVPLLVFLHGGYWRSLGKSDFSFVAQAYADAGAVVAVPDYALCPAVSVAHICVQMARCLAWAGQHAADWGADAARCVVAGHSAGGHLAAMLLACDWPRVDGRVRPGWLQQGVALSGLFEMAPIRRTPYLQVDLRLRAADVPRLSPAGFAAPRAARLQAYVGALESGEFRRQNRAIASAWGKKAVPVCEEVPGCHHFSILEAWAGPGSRCHGGTLAALGLAAQPPRPSA
jgi:arylformamidase